MKPSQVELFFSGFCAVSGSPVRPNDYNRYLLTLPLVSGEGERTGAMHYCCWPCVCDSQDFIRVDTLTIPTNHGPRQYHFAVVGNPCENEEVRRGERRTSRFLWNYNYSSNLSAHLTLSLLFVSLRRRFTNRFTSHFTAEETPHLLAKHGKFGALTEN